MKSDDVKLPEDQGGSAIDPVLQAHAEELATTLDHFIEDGKLEYHRAVGVIMGAMRGLAARPPAPPVGESAEVMTAFADACKGHWTVQPLADETWRNYIDAQLAKALRATGRAERESTCPDCGAIPLQCRICYGKQCHHVEGTSRCALTSGHTEPHVCAPSQDAAEPPTPLPAPSEPDEQLVDGPIALSDECVASFASVAKALASEPDAAAQHLLGQILLSSLTVHRLAAIAAHDQRTRREAAPSIVRRVFAFIETAGTAEIQHAIEDASDIELCEIALAPEEQ